MVLRKPYAFFIRHFKAIHLILTALMIFFFVKVRNIVGYLTTYVNLNIFNQVFNIIEKYFDLWTFLLPILIIAILIMIIWLLKMKEKPVKYYVITIFIYISQMILVFMALSLFSNIESGNINVTFTQIFRDLIDVFSYLPIPFIVIALVRGVGFNIKQFNFKKDLSDLVINDSDSEEFEVEVEVDTEDLKAKINKKLRFIKYVYLENKLLFLILSIALVLTLGIGVFIFINSQEKIYDQNHPFTSYSVNLKIMNSYKTQEDYRSNIIRNDKFYIIVDLDATNLANQDVSIPYGNIYLRVSDDVKYEPTDKYIDEFSDFGLRFISSNKLQANANRQIILVYEIDSQYQNNPLVLEFLVNSDKDKKEYVKLNLKPVTLDKVQQVEEAKLGDVLTFKDSLIAGTELTISEVEFKNRYNFKYKQVIGSIEREFNKAIVPTDTLAMKKTIMRIKSDLKQNDKLSEKIYSSIYERFGTIEYEEDGKTFRQSVDIIDLTPNNSEYTYLEVAEKCNNSKKVSLIFTIRDREYKYVLVDKE